MSPQVIRELQNATPFQPYIIHMTDGKAINVPSREFLTINPTGRTVFVWETNGAFHFLDSLLIARVEIAAAQPSTNGQNG